MKPMTMVTRRRSIELSNVLDDRCWSRNRLLMVAMLMMGTATPAMGGFIDMDTPLDKRTTKSFIDGSVYELVMSDEFNVPNRTFTDGHDPIWTALDKSDDDSSSAGGGSMQFYNSTMATTTEDGMLKISTKLGDTSWVRYDTVKKQWKEETKHFQSAMLQSWNKFCFTGGIVEVDVIFPGDPSIGGLWPAVWILGNLGRATYEASTNNIWPWSYDTCDRKKQPAQAISACNAQNHYGMHPYQGRGATEIDIVEVMTGDSQGPLPSTDPPVELPYADMTLQVAPGVPENRPQSGKLPLLKTVTIGHMQYPAQTWYEGLERQGNTSINPFFYGTYLAETKKNEPVTRTKKQAFQADAVGVAHQLTRAHFEKKHTFRLEWQPGPGGRLDWFAKGYRVNETFAMKGDGNGQDWIRVYTIKDWSIRKLMGSQIPIEPSYLIMNTAISSTWGFPYDVPDWCEKCYDCHDPKCACSFYAGFCKMLSDEQTEVAMYIDSIRVYQSSNASAHVGANHSVGCDPPDYPTKEWIMGHAYRYMRNAPFSYADHGLPLQRQKRGGGKCVTDNDCGGHLRHENFSLLYESFTAGTMDPTIQAASAWTNGHGRCVDPAERARALGHGGLLSFGGGSHKVCMCDEGFTGPYCLAQIFVDDSPSAYAIKHGHSPFKSVEHLYVTPFMGVLIAVAGLSLIATISRQVLKQKQTKLQHIYLQQHLQNPPEEAKLRRPMFQATNTDHRNLRITGTSI